MQHFPLSSFTYYNVFKLIAQSLTCTFSRQLIFPSRGLFSVSNFPIGSHFWCDNWRKKSALLVLLCLLCDISCEVLVYHIPNDSSRSWNGAFAHPDPACSATCLISGAFLLFLVTVTCSFGAFSKWESWYQVADYRSVSSSRLTRKNTQILLMELTHQPSHVLGPLRSPWATRTWSRQPQCSLKSFLTLDLREQVLAGASMGEGEGEGVFVPSLSKHLEKTYSASYTFLWHQFYISKAYLVRRLKSICYIHFQSNEHLSDKEDPINSSFTKADPFQGYLLGPTRRRSRAWLQPPYDTV